MINSCAAFRCSNRAIENDNRAFHKCPLNNSGGFIFLRNICTHTLSQKYFHPPILHILKV